MQNAPIGCPASRTVPRTVLRAWCSPFSRLSFALGSGISNALMTWSSNETPCATHANPPASLTGGPGPGAMSISISDKAGSDGRGVSALGMVVERGVVNSGSSQRIVLGVF